MAARRSLPVAVVFDCDGLLLDTETAWTRAEEALYREHGSEFTPEHKRELLGTAGSQAALILGRHLGRPDDGEALMAELHARVMDEVARFAPPRPGAVELVRELGELGVPLGLASNSFRRFVDRALEVSGFAGAFDVVLSAEQVEHPKPAPDVYLAACTALDAAPSAAVALEDSPTGTASARAAGMTVVGVPSLPGIRLADAHVVGASLAAPEVRSALGLPPAGAAVAAAG